ncbi:hypothetical protein PQR11_15680 [Paraburkholderia strydomiana]|uniref:hypothetical protein n=1 Tax=Paraburkholderia strydomiana TaxID=1245417 RepID=UPI0038B951A4
MPELKLKRSECVPHAYVLALEGEIQRTRHTIGDSFEAANESFVAYMDEVSSFDIVSAPTEIDTTVRRNAFWASLVQRFPSCDDVSTNQQYKGYMVEACLHLARAEKALALRNTDESWFFLSGSKECLGKAEGHYSVASEHATKASRSTRGGKQKSENAKRKAREILIELLGTLAPPGGWPNTELAVMKVSGEALRIFAKKRIPIEDVYAMLFDLLKNDKEVTSAFDRAGR